MARDLVELVKPQITLMSLIMASGGFLLAPTTSIDWLTFFMALVGTAFAVGAANALNMYLERDSDRFMTRTSNRPLPTGRMAPSVALVFGLMLQAASLVLLWVMVNPLTGLLGLGAFILYVFVYTPMKRRSPMALPVGAIPGAMPSLMGWVAATGQIDLAGIIYTAILFFWQLPHFLAIACYRKEEYARASIKTTPLVRGELVAKYQAIFFTVILVIVSLMLVPVGVAGWFYFMVASGLGGWFLWLGFGALKEANEGWAKRFFLASLVYLPVLAFGLVVDVVLL